MAAKLGDVPPSTVMSWHKNRRIPAWRHAQIMLAASAAGFDLGADELANVRPDEDETQEAAA